MMQMDSDYIGVVLNAVSAFAALGSALCWGRVALIKVPAEVLLLASMTNLDPITRPLAKQGLYNQWGAGLAACAAIPQVFRLLL